MNNKGIALFIVLATVFMVILLGNIILGIVSSHSRLTHHQVSRIQAQYAAYAGANYALDKLRRGDDPANWPVPAANTSYTRNLCRNGCGAPDINEPDLPGSVNQVTIVVAGRGAGYNPPAGAICNPPVNVDVCVSATADYALQ